MTVHNSKNTPLDIAKLVKTIFKTLNEFACRDTNEIKQPTKVAKIAKRKYRIVAEDKLPEYMTGHKELKGVCVGACIYNGRWGTKVPHSAHAHIERDNSKYAGWICFEDEKAFAKRTTCLHELAHIVSNSGHTAKWAREYEKLANGTPKWLTFDWLRNKYGFKLKTTKVAK
jgi:hypothetical protein